MGATTNVRPKLHKCIHCRKRIFQTFEGKYRLEAWYHYGYANQECAGLIAKYATPNNPNVGKA